MTPRPRLRAMTLRWRIGSILAVLALAVGAAAAAASYLDTRSQLRAGIDDTLRSRAEAVNTGLGAGRGGRGGGGDGAADGDGGCPTAGSFQPASAAQLVAADGTVTPCIEGGPALPVTTRDTALRAGQVLVRTVTVGGQGYRLLSTPWHDGGIVQIARSTTESDDLLGRLRLRLAALVAIATVVAAALGWVVATRLARPITRLRDTTHRIASTLDFSTPVDVGGPGEVGSLAASFSTLVSAVAQSREQQRRLVSDASHEMRTPLTSLRTNTELLRRIERLPEPERREVVGDVLADIDELSVLLEELVDLASDLTTAEPQEPVHLGDLARVVAARNLRRTGRQVDVEDAGTATSTGRPRQLERAIANLVDNAVKYSEAGTPVSVTVTGRTVTVADRGRGIPPADLPRVFDRFHRAVDVRSEPGSGLGLSIVDSIVRGHGGSVFARARPDGPGTEVGFTLPG